MFVQIITMVKGIYKPNRVQAGHGTAVRHPDLPELNAVGEQWATGRFRVDTHEHPEHWEIYCQLGGSSTWRLHTSGEERLLQPGDGYLVSPNTKHQLQPTGSEHRFCYAIVDFSTFCQRQLPALASDFDPTIRSFHTGAADELRTPFRLLLAEVLKGDQARLHVPALTTAVTALTIAASRFIHQDAAAQQTPGHPGIRAAAKQMEINPGNEWKIEHLAAIASMSVNQFLRLFRTEFGTTPHKHLVSLRIERAQQQLRDTDASITAIAHLTGFASSQHFATAFKTNTGFTPRQWRKNYR